MGVIRYHSGCDHRYVTSRPAPVSQFIYWPLWKILVLPIPHHTCTNSRLESGCGEGGRKKKEKNGPVVIDCLIVS